MAAAVLAAGSGQDSPGRFRFLPTSIDWTRELPDSPVSAPVLTREYVISALQSGVVLARPVSDGKEVVWARQLAVTNPLAADEETVIASGDQGIVALSVATGQTRWKIPGVRATAPILARGGWIVVATAGRLLALRGADGAEIWSREIGQIASRSAIDGDVVYVPVADGRLVALDLATGAEEKWATRVGASPGEPLIYGDRVYIGAAKALVCLDRESGRFVWDYPVGAAIVGAPAADEDRIYSASMDNLLRAFRRSSGAQEWKVDLGHRPSAGPLLTARTVTVPGPAKSLRGFDKNTGRSVTELKLPHTAVTPPALHPPRDGLPGKLAIIVNDLGRPWLLVMASEAAPAPPALPLSPLTAVPGTSLPLPGIGP